MKITTGKKQVLTEEKNQGLIVRKSQKIGLCQVIDLKNRIKSGML